MDSPPVPLPRVKSPPWHMKPATQPYMRGVSRGWRQSKEKSHGEWIRAVRRSFCVPGMMRWNLLPLKWRGLPAFPTPFSPVLIRSTQSVTLHPTWRLCAEPEAAKVLCSLRTSVGEELELHPPHRAPSDGNVHEDDRIRHRHSRSLWRIIYAESLYLIIHAPCDYRYICMGALKSPLTRRTPVDAAESLDILFRISVPVAE